MSTPSILAVGMHTTAASGGADRYFHGLGQALAREGSPFRAVAFGPGETPSWLRSLGSEQAPLPRRWRAIRQAAFQEKGSRPAVVASHFALYALPLCYGAPGLRHVVHFHGPWAGESKAEGQSRPAVAGKWLVEKLAYRRAARCVVLSRAFGDILRADYGVPASRIAVIPGGIELDRFSPPPDRAALRARLGWPADGFVVLCVRRLAQRMGLETLVEAFARIASRHPRGHLYLAGKGPLAGKLQAACDAAGLGARLRLLGFVPDADLPLMYGAADLTLVPSQALEGFGLVTLESLACGTPVLATPVGGLPEVIGPFSPGLVLAGSGPEAIAAGLDDVLSGRRPLPAAADCRRYAETFAWPLIARRVRQVYEEAAGL